MADTWRATAQAITFATNKDMLDVLNATGSGRVVRVYRAFHFNNFVSAITGIIFGMTLRRITAATSGTTVTPIAHDTDNTALAAQITAGYNRTLTLAGTSLIRQYNFVNEEPIVAGVAQANWLTLIPFCEVWNAGYSDANVQPIVCREVQGFAFYSGTVTVGANDFEIEFTNAAS